LKIGVVQGLFMLAVDVDSVALGALSAFGSSKGIKSSVLNYDISRKNWIGLIELLSKNSIVVVVDMWKKRKR
jgi:hypothetical protein